MRDFDQLLRGSMVLKSPVLPSSFKTLLDGHYNDKEIPYLVTVCLTWNVKLCSKNQLIGSFPATRGSLRVNSQRWDSRMELANIRGVGNWRGFAHVCPNM